MMGEIDDRVGGKVCLEGKRIGDMKGLLIFGVSMTGNRNVDM